jgi:hypothetical protein
MGAPALMAVVLALVAGCSSAGAADDTTAEPSTGSTTAAEPAPTTTLAATTTTAVMDHIMGTDQIDVAEIAAANLAAAGFQDVAVAEASGYASTLETLGCFEDAETGGMGVHWLNESLMDDQVDLATPEALVYELDFDGEVTGLVAHEYIVPVEAWTAEAPPNLFGLDFHQHGTLPLWILHAWIWKDNPSGMFADYNPKVRLCPEDVPVFGVDLP